MHLLKLPKILDKTEIDNFKLICSKELRGYHANWCHFTYREVESLLMTIDYLEEEINKLKNVSKSH